MPPLSFCVAGGVAFDDDVSSTHRALLVMGGFAVELSLLFPCRSFQAAQILHRSALWRMQQKTLPANCALSSRNHLLSPAFILPASSACLRQSCRPRFLFLRHISPRFMTVCTQACFEAAALTVQFCSYSLFHKVSQYHFHLDDPLSFTTPHFGKP